MTNAIFVMYCSIFTLVHANHDYTHYLMSGEWLELHRIPAVWEDARTRCELEGGILPSPINEEMETAIKTMLLVNGVSSTAFVGVHSTSKSNFTTIDGVSLDKPITYSAEASASSDTCLTMSHVGKLLAVTCQEVHPFLCLRRLKARGICGNLDNEYKYKEELDNCYKLHGEARTWHDAFKVCVSEKAHLTIINSLEEAQTLKELIAQYNKDNVVRNYWHIGFHRLDEEYPEYRTIDGRTLLEAGFAEFSNNEPNNFKQAFCGAMHRDGYLDDMYCSGEIGEHAFICEKKSET